MFQVSRCARAVCVTECHAAQPTVSYTIKNQTTLTFLKTTLDRGCKLQNPIYIFNMTDSVREHYEYNRINRVFSLVQLNPRCSNQVGTGVGQRVVPSRRARPHRPNSHHRSHITLFTNIKRPINIPPLCYTPHKHLTPLFVSSDATVRFSSNTIQSKYRIRSTFAIHLFPFPYLFT